MSCCPRDILDAAQQLTRLEDPAEAITRAVISRAYYAALHAVADIYPGDDLAHHSSSHEAIIGRAQAHGNGLEPGRSEAKQVARDLRLFKAMRKVADYRLNEAVFPGQQLESIHLAESIFRRCEIIEDRRSAASVDGNITP